MALLHRDLRRTRACPLIAESVKSIVRVLCCNASSTLATSLLPLTTLPGETIEDYPLINNRLIPPTISGGQADQGFTGVTYEKIVYLYIIISQPADGGACQKA